MRRSCNPTSQLLIFVIYLFNSSPTFAAAWTQGHGTGQVIFTLDNYSTSEAFDEHWNRTNSNIKFSKYDVNPYIEYGLTNDITIGANPLLQDWQSKQAGVKTNGKMAESEFFIRKRLMELGNAVFSVQPLVKTPCIPISGSVGLLACDSYDMELRLLAGYGFKLEKKILDGKIRPFSGQYHFVNLETAYRKHTDNSPDVVKIDGTAGLRLNENILLLGQFFSTNAIKKEHVDTIDSIGKYNNFKLQFSGVVQTGKTTSVQMGVYGGVGSQPSENYYKAYHGIMISFWNGF